MDRKRLLKHLVFLMFFIFIANTLALRFYWYSLIWYFDIMMHALGGMWVAMFFLYVLKRNNSEPTNLRLYFKIILATLVIGVVWEGYEYYIYQYISQMSFDLVDTLSDIFFDIAGANFAYLYFKTLIMPKAANRVKSIHG